jgi:hypothetical protein
MVAIHINVTSESMKTNLLPTLTQAGKWTPILLALMIILFVGGARNLYAEQPEYATNSPAVLLSQRDPVVKRLQIELRRLGYCTGAIDGFMGQDTQNAIELYGVDHGHRTAPVITRWLLTSLGISREKKEAELSESN